MSSLRSLLRTIIALAARLSLRLAAREGGNRACLTILCYHRVLPEAQRRAYFDPELVVTPEMLDVHCRALARHYEVVTLEDGLADWLEGRPSKKPRAAITFDDGYRDNAIHAAPVLARHGVRATFYVVSGLVGTREQPWYDRAGQALQKLGRDPVTEIDAAKHVSPEDRALWLAALEAEAGPVQPRDEGLIMDGATLERLVAEGHRIGSHTVTHPLLDQLDPKALAVEVTQSKSTLEAASGTHLAGFCYPNGNVNEAVKAAVAAARYRYALSSFPGLNERHAPDLLALKRWFISQNRLTGLFGRPSASLFRMEISGLSQKLFRRGGDAR